jgi:hypothetical protein
MTSGRRFVETAFGTTTITERLLPAAVIVFVDVPGVSAAPLPDEPDDEEEEEDDDDEDDDEDDASSPPSTVSPVVSPEDEPPELVAPVESVDEHAHSSANSASASTTLIAPW